MRQQQSSSISFTCTSSLRQGLCGLQLQRQPSRCHSCPVRSHWQQTKLCLLLASRRPRASDTLRFSSTLTWAAKRTTAFPACPAQRTQHRKRSASDPRPESPGRGPNGGLCRCSVDRRTKINEGALAQKTLQLTMFGAQYVSPWPSWAPLASVEVSSPRA